MAPAELHEPSTKGGPFPFNITAFGKVSSGQSPNPSCKSVNKTTTQKESVLHALLLKHWDFQH